MDRKSGVALLAARAGLGIIFLMSAESSTTKTLILATIHAFHDLRTLSLPVTAFAEARSKTGSGIIITLAVLLFILCVP